MKTRSKYFIIVLAVLTSLTGLNSCEKYLRNPLEDKETGEDIKLLIVDFNFVTTRMTIHLKDIASNQYLEGEEVKISFRGNGAPNLITFTGEKPAQFESSTGLLEIGWDPNIPISSDEPIEFTISASSENYISAPMAVSYTTEGIKDIVVKMIPLGSLPLLKGAYDEPFNLKYNSVKSSTDLHFTADIRSATTGTAYEYLNLYTALTNGTLTADSLSEPLVYDDYGFYYQSDSEQVEPPANPVKNATLNASSSVFSSVLRSDIAKCEDGLTLQISRPDGSSGTGSFSYVITFADGSTTDGIVSGTFPLNVKIDQIYYPAGDPSVSVSLTGDAQYDVTGPVELTNLCGSTASFSATPRVGLSTVKFVVRYTCRDAIASAALTIGGKFRKADSQGDWTLFRFVEGITYLQLVPDAEYDFEVIIDNETYEYSLPTNPESLENYLLENQDQEFYLIQTLTVTEEENLVTVDTDVELAGDVCDIIQ